jgi:hypothetical protein
MSKTQLVNALEQGGAVSVKNLQDLAMQHANALGKVKALAIWAIDNVKGFPTKISDEDIEQLQLGYRHKYSLDNPPVDYVIIDGNYLRVSDCKTQGIEIPKNAERVSYGVDFAFSFNPNEVGRLKDTHGEFIYHLVSGKDGIRTKCNKAVSNNLGKLISAGKVELDLRNGVKPERKPNLDLLDWIYAEKGPIETMKLRAKNALAKKTASQDDVKKLNNAILAFNVALKK